MVRKIISTICVLALVLAVGVVPASAAQDGAKGAGPGPVRRGNATPLGGGVTAASGKTLPEIDVFNDPGDVTAAAADDDLPGVPRNWDPDYLPFYDTVDQFMDTFDVYPVYLEIGDYVYLNLDGAEAAEDLDLMLFNPAGELAEWAGSDTPNEVIEGTVTENSWPTDGYWYVVVYAFRGGASYLLDGQFTCPDDNVFADPGFTTPGLPTVPFVTYLDGYTNWDDVFRVYLNVGDTLAVSAAPYGDRSYNFTPAVYLYGPGTTDVWNDSYITWDGNDGQPMGFSHLADTAGWYYVDFYEWGEGADPPNGFTWGKLSVASAVSGPVVYRFYNRVTGTHFYTTMPAERDTVINTMGATYSFDGAAYAANPFTNSAPLHRFYNRLTGTHFYTANPDEKASTIANLSHIYTYEGPAYNVSTAPQPGGGTVWRFINKRTGTHFYTADEAERNSVMANLSHIFTYEGPAFFLAP